MKSALLFLLCCALPAGLRADVSPSPPAKLIALDGPLAAGVPQCVHRFAEESTSVAATFLAEPGRAAKIVADVFLDGGELGAPLSKAVPFQANEKPSHTALLEGVFKLPLPDSEKPVLLRVRIRTTADGESAALAQFRLRVTPKSALKQALTRMTDPARSGPELRITVFGALAGLRELLREWKIPFDDEGADAPARIAAHTLAIGEAQDLTRLPAMGDKATLLLLHHDPAVEPGLTQKITPESIIAELNTLRADDWRASPFFHQQLIAKINQHLTRHE